MNVLHCVDFSLKSCRPQKINLLFLLHHINQNDAPFTIGKIKKTYLNISLWVFELITIKRYLTKKNRKNYEKM